jgi:hypothetical protein
MLMRQGIVNKHNASSYKKKYVFQRFDDAKIDLFE